MLERRQREHIFFLSDVLVSGDWEGVLSRCGAWGEVGGLWEWFGKEVGGFR